jgi:hypothetical protein
MDERKTMSIFGTILDKIFHHANTAQPTTARPSAQTASSPASGGSATSAHSEPATSTQTASPSTTGGQRLQNVDVDAVLSQLASKKGGGGNWRTSIVDLLKLLEMDSSLVARKTLAQELNVHAGANGSAEQNVALQKAVMQKVAENGRKVPDSLRH